MEETRVVMIQNRERLKPRGKKSNSKAPTVPHFERI